MSPLQGHLVRESGAALIHSRCLAVGPGLGEVQLPYWPRQFSGGWYRRGVGIPWDTYDVEKAFSRWPTGCQWVSRCRARDICGSCHLKCFPVLVGKLSLHFQGELEAASWTGCQYAPVVGRWSENRRGQFGSLVGVQHILRVPWRCLRQHADVLKVTGASDSITLNGGHPYGALANQALQHSTQTAKGLCIWVW